MKTYYICPECGHAVIGDRPKQCDICTSSEKYLSFDEHLLHLHEMMQQKTDQTYTKK